jgi:cytochrome c
LEIREGAVDGPIIGKQSLRYSGGAETIYYEIPIKSSLKTATMYLVFKNPENELRYIGHADWISFDFQR